MPRAMSCSLTIDSVRAGTKTVTRRHVGTWRNLYDGDHLILVEKAMGLPRGARQIKLAEVKVTDVRDELLTAVFDEPDALEREGISNMSPNRFAYWWAEQHGYKGCQNPDDLARIYVRRIEWRYLGWYGPPRSCYGEAIQAFHLSPVAS